MGTVEQAAVEGLQARLMAAAERFQELNKHLPAAEGEYRPPLGWDLNASVTALAEMLIEAGVIGNDAYVIRVLTHQVESLEASLKECADHLREKAGVIVPIGLAGRGQG